MRSSPPRSPRAPRRPTSRSDPERTCIGCGRRRAQRELVRVSVGADGTLRIGAGAGRGAYLCPDAACVERAVQSRALPRRLRADVRLPDDLEALVAGGRNPLG